MPALGSLVAAALAVAAMGCGSESQPNVLLISMDTLRGDHVGAIGYERDTTPNIDALADEGATFLRAYSQAPNTAPSHTSVLSSLYPSVHGVHNHGQVLDESVVTLPEAFRAAGYATGAFTQLVGETYRQGFETYVFLESPYDKGKGLGDTSMIEEWIGEKAAADAPFFMFLHSYDVHLPYGPPDEYRDKWASDYDGQLPARIFRTQIDRINAGEMEMSPRDYQYLLDLYDAELFRADEILGTLFDHLRELGILDNTIVVIFADHGEEFGEHQQWGRHNHSLYNELLHVPLIMRGPGVASGARIDATVSAVDIAPTLVALAGIETPDLFMGGNLEPLWSGQENESRPIVSEHKTERILISGGYKFFSDGRLFDLRVDPTEQVDIAADNPGVVERLQRELDDWVGRFLAMAGEVDTSGPVSLTREQKRRLRALGYLE